MTDPGRRRLRGVPLHVAPDHPPRRMDRRAHPPARRALVLSDGRRPSGLLEFSALASAGSPERWEADGGATWAGAGRYSAGTVREWPHDLRRLRAPAARHRSGRDQRMARLARRRDRHAWQDASPLHPDAAPRTGPREPGQLPGHREHALHQHDPARAGAVVPRRRAHRAPDPRVRAVERGDDGHQGEQARRRHRWPPVDVRQLGVAVRDRLQPLLPRQGRRQARRSRLLPGPRRARHLRQGVHRGSPHGGRPRPLPPGDRTRWARACRAIRTRG